MIHATTIIFQHSIRAPKGFRFDYSVTEKVFNCDQNARLVFNGRCIVWQDAHYNNCHDVSETDWDLWLKPYLVAVE